MEIYPSIFVDTYEEFGKRVHLIESVASFLHIDVGDGIFVPHKSFKDIEKVTQFPFTKPFELHLMLDKPAQTVLPWLKTQAVRVIFHWEAKQGGHTWVHGLLRIIKQARKHAGIALNPSTSAELIYPFLDDLDLILLMSVEPGFSGQKFIPGALAKITALREKNFSGIIEVDGGVNEETIVLVRKAGADVVAVANAIFEKEKPKEALLKLKAQSEKGKTTM